MKTPIEHAPHVQQFLAELEALCARYAVCLEPIDYHGMLIRRRGPEDASSIDWHDFVGEIDFQERDLPRASRGEP